MTDDIFKPEGRPRKKRMPSPASLANLIPFKKGQNGQNGWSFKSALKMKLQKNPELRDRFITSMIEGAILREPTPFREMWDRVDGRLQDNPLTLQDNRQVNIYVMDNEAKELLGRVADRTNLLEDTDA